MAMGGRVGEYEATTGPGRGRLVRFLAACWRCSLSPRASGWHGACEAPRWPVHAETSHRGVLTGAGSYPARLDDPSGARSSLARWQECVGLARYRRGPYQGHSLWLIAVVAGMGRSRAVPISASVLNMPPTGPTTWPPACLADATGCAAIGMAAVVHHRCQAWCTTSRFAPGARG
jgi:hypothetical protein